MPGTSIPNYEIPARPFRAIGDARANRPTINRQQIESQSALFGDVELFAASGLR
jgi:hypothetical protein